ncbi:RICIN domain-containing protein [Streptomyces sp. NPDC053069]|uniref:RICIN domain-containing protein n=1 Tax=Streptomyces sp. NPDC053069 TaxID=3365695 RepID=UPI0037D97439
MADQLAQGVRQQWEAEARLRRLDDAFPLPVAWEAADPDLVEFGEPGAGKTMLLICLLLWSVCAASRPRPCSGSAFQARSLSEVRVTRSVPAFPLPRRGPGGMKTAAGLPHRPASRAGRLGSHPRLLIVGEWVLTFPTAREGTMIHIPQGSPAGLARRGLYACGALLLALIALITSPGTSSAIGWEYPVRNGDIYEIRQDWLVMDVYGSSHDDEASVIAFDYWPNHANQLWRAERGGQDAGGTYWYFRNLNSGRVLDVRRGERNAGLDQFRFQSSMNQQWYVRQLGTTAVLINRQTNQMITLTDREQELRMADVQVSSWSRGNWILTDKGPLRPREL